ncbi:DEAD/DEAH box helicase domain-containing protein [Streptomyces sp. DvalAA-14]|uniref:DEAD/DEAH box helicase n=1 Tax=unclassified Streptomyces TaxID=2593676 RepID=UPI00081AF10E|nr:MULTISPECIES: DEAD/DEAH box helicase [unclassified Streptomyces]MYS20879.1 DEAD/DEAH box helicase [Streptomyces sp. SID4948]SCD78916.1 DEAD/DEAH box helicase domain-containing protein [Streptomyces sp. DvalAA-14]
MAQEHSPQSAHGRPSPRTALERLAEGADRAVRITHTEHVPARVGRHASWPAAIRPEVIDAIRAAGIDRPWEHQALAAGHAARGESVVVSTGTASGKSLAYLAPVLSALLEGSGTGPRGATALYLSPTKALAADQRRAVSALAAPLGAAVRPAVYDGDTPFEEREWVRQYANYVLTNPDMLHRGILPGHARWASFLRGLRYVVIDECHTYRGVFGSHVAQVLRRLRRVCARYGADPVFLLASATSADPGRAAARLTGVPVAEVTEDTSPRGELAFALWEPPLTELSGEHGAPVRRTATAEAAELLTDLVIQGVRTVAFVRSRRGAELIALIAQERLAAIDPSLPGRVAAYRGGYLAEERRALERDLHSGRLLGLASTSALELGVDISGLDAVLLVGYPGTRASLWQQAGRAGRSGQGALAVMVGRDDPLDTYLVHHPEAIFEQPVESTVLDPDNPYVLAPHLCAAAAELPLTDPDLELFGPEAASLVAQLVERGLLRRRAGGWYWTRRERAADLTDIRGEGGKPIQVVESATGRLLGTVDAGAAHTTVHDGAVHLHQGRSYLVRRLDLEDHVALVEQADPPYSTMARDTTEIRVLSDELEEPWGEARIHFGSVEVTHQVVSFLRRRLLTGEVLGETKLDLPPRTLRTRAVWWTVTDDQLDTARIHPEELPGALHAAEHASIGLLPLFATCDRWDIGGVSIPLHGDTGLPTVFVYDGHPGGAGFAERAYRTARSWLTATREAIAACECEFGCPSCVQSPKCGNGNDPLDKAAAVRLLDCLLSTDPAGSSGISSGISSDGEPERADGADGIRGGSEDSGDGGGSESFPRAMVDGTAPTAGVGTSAGPATGSRTPPEPGTVPVSRVAPDGVQEVVGGPSGGE